MRITLDGVAVEAEEGDTVAAALLRARITTFTRSIKYHRPRGPFCLQGSCGQCLMRVDGLPSALACKVPAQEGMICERQISSFRKGSITTICSPDRACSAASPWRWRGGSRASVSCRLECAHRCR